MEYIMTGCRDYIHKNIVAEWRNAK